VALAARLALVQLTVPEAPTAGRVQVNEGPDVCTKDVKPTLAGSVSTKVTFSASSEPRLLTLSV
jgi:hypothetical protein